MKSGGILVIIGGILIILSALAISGDLIPSGEEKYDLTCNVIINNIYALSPTLGDISCATKRSGLFSLGDIFYDEGTLSITAQGITKAVNYKVQNRLLDSFVDDDYTITLRKLDPGNTEVLVKLRDQDGNLLDSKNLNIDIGGTQ